ncbi:hypothetical protein [Serratia fonticola]
MRNIIFLLLCIISSNAAAGLWPIPNSITVTGSGLSYRYAINGWSLVEVGQASETPAPENGSVCAGHKHKSGAGDFSANCVNDNRVTPGTNIGSIARGIQLPVSISHSGPPGDECVGVFYTRRSAQPWSNAIFPPGSCVSVPPPDVWCSVVQPSITIDHGQLSIKTGTNTAQTDFDVTCTTPVSIKILLGTDVIDLRNGLNSRLKIEGEINGRHQMNSGLNHRAITSTINTDNAQSAGVYSGSSVLFLEYY